MRSKGTNPKEQNNFGRQKYCHYSLKKKKTVFLMQQNFRHFLSKPLQVLTVERECYMPAGIKHKYFGHLPKNYMPGY